ncbi:MAG TPA: DUF1566 domain-containing protein [Gallionella sp.]|nr:DUF1566 domain-containing protein [Gallionella sp.]
MKNISTIAGIGLLLAASLASAANCRLGMEASTPSERFQTRGETVADGKTTLVWMRCAIGQQWNGSICTGAPQSMGWNEAKAAVERLNREGYAGHSDWRLPALPELASIVERQCFNPRMNEAVFPGAPSTVAWSGMEKSGTADLAYALDFGGGAAQATLKNYKGTVRLVRGGPWWEPPKMMAAK